MKVLKMNDHVRFENTLGIMDCDQFDIIVPTESGWYSFYSMIYRQKSCEIIMKNQLNWSTQDGIHNEFK